MASDTRVRPSIVGADKLAPIVASDAGVHPCSRHSPVAKSRFFEELFPLSATLLRSS